MSGCAAPLARHPKRRPLTGTALACGADIWAKKKEVMSASNQNEFSQHPERICLCKSCLGVLAEYMFPTGLDAL